MSSAMVAYTDSTFAALVQEDCIFAMINTMSPICYLRALKPTSKILSDIQILDGIIVPTIIVAKSITVFI